MNTPMALPALHPAVPAYQSGHTSKTMALICQALLDAGIIEESDWHTDLDKTMTAGIERYMERRHGITDCNLPYNMLVTDNGAHFMYDPEGQEEIDPADYADHGFFALGSHGSIHEAYRYFKTFYLGPAVLALEAMQPTAGYRALRLLEYTLEDLVGVTGPDVVYENQDFLEDEEWAEGDNYEGVGRAELPRTFGRNIPQETVQAFEGEFDWWAAFAASGDEKCAYALSQIAEIQALHMEVPPNAIMMHPEMHPIHLLALGWQPGDATQQVHDIRNTPNDGYTHWTDVSYAYFFVITDPESIVAAFQAMALATVLLVKIGRLLEFMETTWKSTTLSPAVLLTA